MILLRTGIAGGLCLALAAGLAGTASGQTGSVDLGRSSTNPTVIAAQLRSSLKSQELALQQLSAPPSSESLEAAARSIYRAYHQVRLAHAGVLGRMARAERFKDPLLGWQEERIQAARNMLLGALDQAKNANRLREYGRIARGLQLLNSATKAIQQVLDVMP